MKLRLRRRYGWGQLHFIICSCYRRAPLLGTERARHLFLKILDEVRERYDFALIGYVVMPEHIHLLISEPNVGTPSTEMQVLKQRVSREQNPNPSHFEGFGTPASFNRAWVQSGAARKGWPPARERASGRHMPVTTHYDAAC
jgi:REP element-mobilizing transposase RayT